MQEFLDTSIMWLFKITFTDSNEVWKTLWMIFQEIALKCQERK